MADIVVVDYGMGNLRSVAKAIERVAPGHAVRVSDDPQDVLQAERVVFPGQGAMPDCMRELDRRRLRAAVLQAAREKPFLGICIGLQMLFGHSEEGDAAGLGILPGRVVRFGAEVLQPDASGAHLKVPHMGWNTVEPVGEHPLWTGIATGSRFYFVHSYHVVADNETLVAARTPYGSLFTSAVVRDNIVAVQFHPEKSAANGLKLLENFVGWQP